MRVRFATTSRFTSTVMRTLLDMSTTAQIKDSLKLGNEVLSRIGKVGRLHKAAVEQARAEYQRLKATLAASGGDTAGIDAQLACNLAHHPFPHLHPGGLVGAL